MPTDQHSTTDFCFYCAPDEVIAPAVSAALNGRPHQGPTIHMQRPYEACPVMCPPTTTEGIPTDG